VALGAPKGEGPFHHEREQVLFFSALPAPNSSFNDAPMWFSFLLFLVIKLNCALWEFTSTHIVESTSTIMSALLEWLHLISWTSKKWPLCSPVVFAHSVDWSA